MVPKIENVSPDVELVSLHQSESLRYGEIPVVLERRPKGVSRNVTVAGCPRTPEGDDGGSADKVWIDVIIQSALN